MTSTAVKPLEATYAVSVMVYKDHTYSALASRMSTDTLRMQFTRLSEGTWDPELTHPATYCLMKAVIELDLDERDQLRLW